MTMKGKPAFTPKSPVKADAQVKPASEPVFIRRQSQV